jgi:hypothetical protein
VLTRQRRATKGQLWIAASRSEASFLCAFFLRLKAGLFARYRAVDAADKVAASRGPIMLSTLQLFAGLSMWATAHDAICFTSRVPINLSSPIAVLCVCSLLFKVAAYVRGSAMETCRSFGLVFRKNDFQTAASADDALGFLRRLIASTAVE